MTHPLRGRLYWAHLDKRRPVLVVSSDRFNARSAYVTVVPGSSRLRPLVTHVALAPGDAGVSRPTMLLCEHINELHKSELDSEPLGPPLRATKMREVAAAITFYLDLGDDMPSVP